MKRTFAGIALSLGLLAGPVLAAGAQGNGGSSFALGLQLGGASSPNGESGFSGLTARVGREKTIEGVLAFNQGGTWIVNGNFLIHSHNLFHQDPISAIKFYGGFGVGVWAGHESGFWAQVPLGVDFDFAIPVEASLYIAPGIDIVPTTQANIHFGLGLRYWFM
jgi:hypothetical protein